MVVPKGTNGAAPPGGALESGRNVLQYRRNKMFKRIFATLMLVGMFGSIAGCNTISGMGKDIERAGEATQETAADVKRKM